MINNINNDNNYISILFLKIWRNQYIKNIILKYCSIFKLHNQTYMSGVTSPSFKYILSYKGLDYCKSFHIKDSSCLFNLPKDVERISIYDTIIIKEEPESHLNQIMEYFKESPITELSIKLNFFVDNRDYINHHTPNKDLPENKKSFEILQNIVKCLPSNLKKLNLSTYSSSIEPYTLPNTLVSLSFYGNTTLKDHSIPYSVEELILENYNLAFTTENVMPPSLKKVTFGFRYNQPLNTNLFKNCKQLKTIHFGKKFNQSLEPGVLPSSLKKICFPESSAFSKPLKLNSLPNGIKKITFPQNFNQPFLIKKKNFFTGKKGFFSRLFKKQNQQDDEEIGDHLNDYESILPKSLEFLKVGLAFNQSILKGSIPESVTVLDLSGSVIKKFDDNAIPNVKVLTMPREIQQFGESLFPNNIQEINIPKITLKHYQVGKLKIPVSVKKFKVGEESTNVSLQSFLYPEQVYQFEELWYKNHILRSFSNLQFNYCHIKELYIHYTVYENINNLTLPTNLEKLVLSGGIDNSFYPNYFSMCQNSLKYLEIQTLRSQVIPIHCVPPTLETLVLGEIYSVSNIEFIKTITNLQTLVIGKIFNGSIKHLKTILPQSITTLEIREEILLSEISLLWVPENLKTLILRSNSPHVALNNLPRSIEKICYKNTDFIIYHQKYFNNSESMEYYYDKLCLNKD
ncbi:hypothetical protein DICPUDRAFT_79998 [Dictyostelium purpureum]|uniref:FNIP repeat-containing protein n=1 Tax=Dictyostelium purpureum TaxID=5786 RepID=F0ZP85_DICPU|nr:uncharacterized protein DICPUDRAFT_79998 [Dictyostelium purpureum]EGC34249.1 hypothetical protein DICPUDRAFT_79998 [Dictyostelium purpureum]|eukprot:XP_003289218.1 hypothetical protein DICPUDRAFT_79998 [Dictyostelium purpureum]